MSLPEAFRDAYDCDADMIFVVTLLGPVVSLFIDNDWEGVIAEAVSEAGAWEASEPPDFERFQKRKSGNL